MLSSLSLAKEMSQRQVLVTASFFPSPIWVFVYLAPEPTCRARRGGAIRELMQPGWAWSPPSTAVDGDANATFLVGSMRKKVSYS